MTNNSLGSEDFEESDNSSKKPDFKKLIVNFVAIILVALIVLLQYSRVTSKNDKTNE